jgi:hypothetical protein
MWDNVKKSFLFVSKFTQKQNAWNKLKKGQGLSLLIFEDGKYTYQVSKVISVKEYESICNVRFKYTKNGKRIRVNLAVNKLKYSLPYLAIKRNTEWARDYNPVYGDMIVSFNGLDILNNIYNELITNKIKEQEEIVVKEKDTLSKLYSLQYNKIV